MEVRELTGINGTNDLIAVAQEANVPVLVLDGADECLVAMRPAVFERLLFDGERLGLGEAPCRHF